MLRNEDTAFALQKVRLSLGSDDFVVYNGAPPVSIIFRRSKSGTFS